MSLVNGEENVEHSTHDIEVEGIQHANNYSRLDPVQASWLAD